MANTPPPNRTTTLSTPARRRPDHPRRPPLSAPGRVLAVGRRPRPSVHSPRRTTTTNHLTSPHTVQQPTHERTPETPAPAHAGQQHARTLPTIHNHRSKPRHQQDRYAHERPTLMRVWLKAAPPSNSATTPLTCTRTASGLTAPATHPAPTRTGIYNAIRRRRTGRLQWRAHRLHYHGGRRKPEGKQSPLRRGGGEISGRAQCTSAGRIRTAASSATRRSASESAVGCFQRLLSA